MNHAALKETARRIRLADLDAVFAAGAGHIGGEMSAIDILTGLYFGVLRIEPDNPDDPKRDRFVLSKGHTACALYVTLAEKGFMPRELLATFLKPHSPLNGHPNRVKVPGVETNTGPLGHGLPVAVGMAKAAKLDKASWRTFVLCGDGELQEGSNWEAAMAAAQFELDNLTLIVDHNRLQQGARVADTNALAPDRREVRGFRLGDPGDRRTRHRRDPGRPRLRRGRGREGPSAWWRTPTRDRAFPSCRTVWSGTTRCPTGSSTNGPARNSKGRPDARNGRAARLPGRLRGDPAAACRRER